MNNMKRANELKAEAEFWSDALRKNTFGTARVASIRIRIGELHDLARQELETDTPPARQKG